MPKRGKRYQASAALVEAEKLHTAQEAIDLVAQMPKAKFDETLEISMRLGVDPTKSDQLVRGAVVLPAGLGKTLRVIVFAEGEKQKEAADAGADEVGMDELVEKISEGWLDFDVAIATPDVMGKVAKVAKVLGPRGLMPNPKTGTVTFEVASAVSEAKAGKVDFRVDKAGNLHVPIGKRSFDAQQQLENLNAVIDAIMRAKPSTSKGIYLKALHLASTMGPSVSIDPAAYRK